jgi:hypothetical protein
VTSPAAMGALKSRAPFDRAHAASPDCPLVVNVDGRLARTDLRWERKVRLLFTPPASDLRHLASPRSVQMELESAA